jgi:REP element-mobilizing transposase RayT
MARKARAEVEGGLYHVIVRGNNRRRIFDSAADHRKFLSLLAAQKIKLPFLLYAYCLMTNHVHLLLERQKDRVGHIMHRVLTGYTQYYNRRHQRVGHLLQGRHKAILCQSDRYLAELVRYIHLNPVRAQMVSRPEQYQYSSHRASLGLEAVGIVDVDPVLRHFGARKELARKAYRQFILAP